MARGLYLYPCTTSPRFSPLSQRAARPLEADGGRSWCQQLRDYQHASTRKLG